MKRSTVCFALVVVALLVAASGLQERRGTVLGVSAAGEVTLDVGHLDGVRVGMQARAYYLDPEAKQPVYVALLEVTAVEGRTAGCRVVQKTVELRSGFQLEWRGALEPPPQRSAAEWLTEGSKAFEAGQYDQAKQYFANARLSDPGLASAVDPLIADCERKQAEAKAAAEQQQREEAARAQREAELAADRQRAPSYRILARSHAAAGRAEEALELWQKVLAAIPEDAEARQNLVVLLSKQAESAQAEGRLDEAVELWRQYLVLQPDDETGKRNLNQVQQLQQLQQQEQQRIKKLENLDLGNGIVIRFKRIPAGSFQMGASPGDSEAESDESPAHRVTISREFYMGVTEVTQAQWRAVMGTNPSHFTGDDRPVENVSWNDAVAFCEKLSRRTGQKYRLPTEAEWEYAARAGTTTTYYWGTIMDGAYAWWTLNSGRQNHSVGQKRPNGWGLYDMSGNVWEWCSDWYGDYPDRAETDPKGARSGSHSWRVLRGGSWYSDAGWLRVSNRLNGTPGYRYYDLGFRLVREGS